MTRIGIVGGGRGATLHAEAVRAASGVTLVGVGGRTPGTAGELAAAMRVDDLPLDVLADRADALVMSVPPAAVGSVAAALPADLPLLVESPTAGVVDRDRSMTAANLLHAPVVGRGLRMIAELGAVHHLQLRGAGPRPSWGTHGSPAWGGGVLVDPHATTLPVLLAAAATPVTAVRGALEGPASCEEAARLELELADGRIATAEVVWRDQQSVTVELEAAADDGVVTVRLLPVPELERDGRSVVRANDPPLVALGFVAQIERFAGAVRGERVAWPPLTVGIAVSDLAESVRRQSRP